MSSVFLPNFLTPSANLTFSSGVQWSSELYSISDFSSGVNSLEFVLIDDFNCINFPLICDTFFVKTSELILLGLRPNIESPFQRLLISFSVQVP